MPRAHAHSDEPDSALRAGKVAAWFVTTHWTVVLTAARHDTTRTRVALAELCQIYWYPLYAYVRRRGSSPEDAQDLTQAFFERLIEKDTLAQITREGGKFRSFLLTALNHFLIDAIKWTIARKRGGGQIIQLDALSAEARYKLEPVDPVTPEQVYARNWARSLLETAVGKLRREYEAGGMAPLFEQLKFCLTVERHSTPYADLARQLGISEGSIKVRVHRLRLRYREWVRAEVANTVATPDEVEEELQHLFRALIS
jgi:RNA polymerase sigma-70 factor (ECF subfamily)